MYSDSDNDNVSSPDFIGDGNDEWIGLLDDEIDFLDEDDRGQYVGVINEDLSPKDMLDDGKEDLQDADLDTTEFVSILDDNDTTMIKRDREQFVKGYVPKRYKNTWRDVAAAQEFVENAIEETKMGGKVMFMLLKFKELNRDQIEQDYGTNQNYLVENSIKICSVISYLTGVMMLKRLRKMDEDGIEKSGKYFKIIIHISSIFVKPDENEPNGLLYRTYSHEEELHKFARNGIPWGIASPTLAYKVAFTCAQRAIWKTKTPTSGWRFVRIRTATIQIYEVEGVHARGKGKRKLSEIMDEDSIIDDDDDDGLGKLLLNSEKRMKGVAGGEIKDKEVREDGLLQVIAKAQCVISPNVKSNCFIYSIKIGLICKLHKSDVKNLQRPAKINKNWKELVESHKFDGLNIPEDFPKEVPLSEKFFGWFCELNPSIFLHVWIQIESEHVPIVLFYRCMPQPNKIPVHILFVGPSDGSVPGHYVSIKNIDKLFYRTEKCNRKTKTYCPWCCCYYVRSRCPKHSNMGPIENAYYCGKCMSFFVLKKDLDFHQNKCLITDKNIRTVILPEKDQLVSFSDSHYLHTYKLPVVFIADFESLLLPLKADDEERHKEGSKLWKEEQHVPCSFGITVITQEGVPRFPYFCYTGRSIDEVMDKFCQTIIDMSEDYFEYFLSTSNYHGYLSAEVEAIMKSAVTCHMCGTHITRTKEKKLFPDFDQFTHMFYGAVCDKCQKLKKSENFFIPLVFHNARGYDLHHIVKYITRSKYGCKYTGIPQNGQKLMSMTITREKEVEEEEEDQNGVKITTVKTVKTMCDIRIIDSLLFLLKSLEKLVSILKERHPSELEKAFPHTFNVFMTEGDPDVRDHVEFNGQNGRLLFKFNKEQIEAIMQKNLYPYKWFDSFDKFDRTFDEIKELVRDNKYEAFTDNPDDEMFRKGWVSKKLAFDKVVAIIPQIRTVNDYANIYLACDVCQLADIIESTRNLFMSTHHLDPMYYFGAPGYSWDAFLYELTRERPHMCPRLFGKGDMNKICFFMQGIRGGCSGIMKRYAVANNKHMGDLYDPTKPSSYIIYLDANNLYGWSMQQDLPYTDFAWVTEEVINNINSGYRGSPNELMFTLLDRMERDGYAGFFEVDLHYPVQFHIRDNLYPLAPEKSVVQFEDVSGPIHDLNTLTGYKLTSKTPMLLQTLRDKYHYFVHSKNLRFYMMHGLVVTRLHSGMTFKQTPLMKPYIDKNTQLRNQGTSVFEKELYKLLNNSIYGKTFENPMKYSYLKFVNGEKEYNKVVSMTGFKGAIFTQDDFMIAKVLYEKIKYNKPLYLGATVTEYAKYLMFQFYYDVLKDYYGDNEHFGDPGYEQRVQLLFTDTDSLMLQIFTDDIFKDISEINSEENLEKYGCPFDVSSFDKEVIEEYGIYHPYDKVIGKFKSETGNKLIYRFVGLRSKMYAYQTIDEYKEQLENDKFGCHKRGKGIPGAALNTLTIKSYLECLFGTSDEAIIKEIEEGKRLPNFDDPTKVRQEITTKGIRSFDHKLYSTMTRKFGLSCNDTKRFILANNIDTLAYGHYKINELIREEIENGETDSEEEIDLFEQELEERENQLKK